MAIARPVDRRLFLLLDSTHARLSKVIDKKLAASAGLKTAQAAALAYLGYHDECTLSELAEGVGHNNSAITALVDRMAAAGLVERVRVLSDGRSRKVRLTSLGWHKREAVMGEFRDFNDRMIKGMTPSEIETVYKFLGRALDNVSDPVSDAASGTGSA